MDEMEGLTQCHPVGPGQQWPLRLGCWALPSCQFCQPVLLWVDVSEARCVTVSSAWNLGSALCGYFLLPV